ncbi:8-amino-7-oxononanoate synthase [Hyphomicrobium nitrativorans NL23]|uniref:8-amino-7-oxononanoate synthase n=1 Tax=Hyphomicrobium nitrativorans NL23 TaxID=1029756 RepID=V5SAW7_9HYPH|nr:8-amino-7-oxononanoate synthase [Hyphomicrobium nitrativorans]AHB47956.1 8-amino-7-oxononanoate synthase [Hyphomicrobium nitrativorans NL23]
MHDSHERALKALERRGRLRTLTPRSGVDFSSNDYLGLASSAALSESVARALDRGVAVGAGGSRLLRGNDPEHEALEADAARFFGAESCLYFGGGFLANYALFSTLPARGDLVVHDALIHASVLDGIRAGKATATPAAHNDPEAFDDAIKTWRAGGGTGRPWIAVESLYSMDGDQAPLADLAAVARSHDGMLVIDEAHATGVLGPQGRGLGHALEGAPDVISLHTCGKALGTTGALVLAPRIVRDYLVNRARPFIYATAPSPLMAASVRAALTLVQSEEGAQRRERLTSLVAFAGREMTRRLGIGASGSHIQPIVLGTDERAVSVAKTLIAEGFDIRAVRPPTVPEGTARLRLSLTLNAGEKATARLVDALARALQEVPA